jgi:hypothetical protein
MFKWVMGKSGENWTAQKQRDAAYSLKMQPLTLVILMALDGNAWLSMKLMPVDSTRVGFYIKNNENKVL